MEEAMANEDLIDDGDGSPGRPNVYSILSTLAVVLLSTGTIAYRFMEDWTWVDSFYFSSIAVTTVGFGDLTPTSDVAKIFTVLYIFSGVGIITSFLNERLRRNADRGGRMGKRAG
jgi:hypothetical protein